jgi:dihydropteroate synthase
MNDLPDSRPGPLLLGSRVFLPGRPLVMAIVNRTPDSFFQPGATWDESAAMERVNAAVIHGADIIDIGGVPAHPGKAVDAADHLAGGGPVHA